MKSSVSSSNRASVLTLTNSFVGDWILVLGPIKNCIILASVNWKKIENINIICVEGRNKMMSPKDSKARASPCMASV